MCQGSGGGYGDVLQRAPESVMRDVAEDLISEDTARDIYKVVFDAETRVVDEAATAALRDEERRARRARGRPYDAFVAEWVQPEPPTGLPFFGSWAEPGQIYGVTMGQRVKMPAARLDSMFMLNPKDVRIAQLEAELKAARAMSG
jgi:acetone carboxylase alpha subunit